MTKPIILAPAGGFAAVTAAVRCGADAVYLGAKNFNARRNAENFDDLALPETVKFCHERRATPPRRPLCTIRTARCIYKISAARRSSSRAS